VGGEYFTFDIGVGNIEEVPAARKSKEVKVYATFVGVLGLCD